MEHLAHETAAGAALGDVVVATLVALVAVAALGLFGVAHRAGRITLLDRVAATAGRIGGLPAWAALPAAVTGVALVVAVFGFYWDVASHIDNGRDPGPFANPSHFLIIFGLAGCAVAGYLSILIGRDEHRSAIRIRDGWYAPVGGVLLLLCGGVAVVGFPLDDVWHRLFGQDVTLWSPTHIQMVGGAALSTLALWILNVEARRAAAAPDRWPLRVLEMIVAGSFLVGLSALQAEFDYSVPQFRLLYHPVLLMATAGIALVAARIRLGKGAAIVAVLVFLGIRGIVSGLVGPVMGHTTLHFPLYLVEAVAVELAARWWGTERQFRFAALAGVGIGTFGLAAEWGWSRLWMTMSWPASLGLEGVAFGLLAAIAGAFVGAYVGRALLEPGAPREVTSRGLGIAVATVMLLVLAYPFPTMHQQGSATIDVEAVPQRDGWARFEVRLGPPDLADRSEWFVATAWQGGGSVVKEMQPLGDGRFVSPALPVHGDWKALLRMHDGRGLMALPLYLPADPVIPAEGVPVPASGEERPFVSDKELLLREAKPASTLVTMTASLMLALLVAAWIGAIAWGLAHLERSAARRPYLQ